MEITRKLHRPHLFARGYHIESFTLDSTIRDFVSNKNWDSLNDAFQRLTSPEGSLFQFLKTFHDFDQIEFIISIRDAADEWEEDGIWHDDGSRVFAFSLSLTDEKISGGKLGFKRKNSEEIDYIPTPSYGSIILFLTGVHGFEHKIHRVEKGRRIVIAGWCS